MRELLEEGFSISFMPAAYKRAPEWIWSKFRSWKSVNSPQRDSLGMMAVRKVGG
jgi:hypothetical protein